MAVMHKLKMENRVALVIGGGTGIGKAVAKLFSAEGAKVVVAARRRSPLAATVEEIRGDGGEAALVTGDVSKMEDAKRMIDFTVEQYAMVDVLVNCAAEFWPRGGEKEQIEETQEDDWDRLISVNLKGVFFATKFALPYLVERFRRTGDWKKCASIVNIGSASASFSKPGHSTYCASKGGVVAFTRTVAAQYAQQGIRANVVSPGLIDTAMSRAARPDFDDIIDGAIEKTCLLKRVGEPDDIASAVLYLASDDASWVTGQELFVDGGFSAR
jgi:NAD(P)-dependent dehydrogenase (short-subunit alcohol dehydrogenase family)